MNYFLLYFCTYILFAFLFSIGIILEYGIKDTPLAFIVIFILGCILSTILVFYYFSVLRNNRRYTIYDLIKFKKRLKKEELHFQVSINRRRFEALKKAKEFLEPYNDMFGELTLSNKNCIVTFKTDKNDVAILSCKSKKINEEKTIKSFIAKGFGSGILAPANLAASKDFWSAICMNFSYSTTYANLVEAVQGNFIFFEESSCRSEIEKMDNANCVTCTDYQKIDDEKELARLRAEMISIIKHFKNYKSVEALDINNASENEIKGLPGINIVMAKKIIQRRNTMGAFKNFDDFIYTMKIKPHFAKKLKNLIVIKPIKETNSKGERIIDY